MMYPFIRIKSFLTVTLLSLLPVFAHAQAVSIIGGDSSARECYFSAQIAAQMQSSTKSEVEVCTSALEHGALRLRDLAATYVNRGVLYVALEEYQAATKDYIRAKEIYPEFGAVHVNIGNLFFMSEYYGKAIEEYTKALGLRLNSNHVAHLNRGMAYEKLGKYSEAETDYRTALEIIPEWAIANSKLERVLDKIQKAVEIPPQNG